MYKVQALLLLIFMYLQCKSESIHDVEFLPIEQSLSQHSITSLIQDEDGFLWIGTRSGLNKYDGANMLVYDQGMNGEDNLKSGYIRTMFEDQSGTIWIGTLEGGLSKYIKKTESFKTYQQVSGDHTSLNDKSVTAIYEDHLGNLWVGTIRGGLNKFDRETETFSHYKHNLDDPFSISNNHITAITEDSDGNLWVGTWGGGLNLLDRNSSRFIRYQVDPNFPSQSLSSNIIRNISTGSRGVLWISTQKGLNKLYYDQQGKYVIEPIRIQSKSVGSRVNVALCAMEDRHGRVWVGTENGGIVVLNLDSEIITHYDYDATREFGLKSNSIWLLFEDKSGVMWVGTYNKGIFKVDPDHQKFKHYKQNPFDKNSLSYNTVSCFAEDDNNNLWIGTDGGGLNYWDTKLNRFTHYNSGSGKNQLISDNILTLNIDHNGELWVGTWESGVYILNREAKRFRYFNINEEIYSQNIRPSVMSIIQDDKKRTWMSVFRDGLYVYDHNENLIDRFTYDETDPNSISNNLVISLKQDSFGNIWVGTEGGGLNRCYESTEGFKFERFLFDQDDSLSISGNIVTSIEEDSNRRLWIGTTQGLNLFDHSSKSFRRFDKRHGLANAVIYGVREDNSGKIWISTNNGLSKIDLQDNTVRNYDKSDGLQSSEFFRQASYKLKGGELVFGGINGFNLFDPEELKENTNHPVVYFRNFRLSNNPVKPGPGSILEQNINMTENIKLKHDQNDFSFDFSVLSFQQSNKNVYAYQLENYDRDWQHIGNRTSAFYTNVPPGSYTFKVKGTNNDGIWSDHIASVRLRIYPAWYNTYWAYSLYIIIVTSILVWGIQTIVNRERLQTKLKMEHMELSKMQELDEMKSRFFANISHEFRSPLTLILGPLKEMYDDAFKGNAKEQIALMIRNAESLLKQINQLLDLSKVESGNMKLEATKQDLVQFLKPILHSFNSLADGKYIGYKIVLPNEPIEIYFEKDKMEKIVVNLLSNAFKYTSEFGKITFGLNVSNDNVVMMVADNGIGIPSDEIDYIFNRYYRVNDKQIRKNKGTGIGLSLTKELVELHKGKIELISEVNAGTTFKVYLPLGKGHLDQSDILDQSVDYNFEKQGLYEIDENLNDYKASSDIDVIDEENSNPLILLVEDNSEIRNYIKSILQQEYRVIEADNGSRAIQLAKQNIPDLIITDIMMPEMDGYELCKIIKTDIKTSHIPVIALTAKASNESALEGFERGVDYYITKPFNPKMLLLRIRNIINTSDQIKSNLLNKELEIAPKDIKIASKDENFLKQAISIVEENMSNSEFYVDDLGRELGLSRMQLYRKLKGLIGQSANEFVRSIRLKRAAQLIKQKNLTISEITYEVGFNDLQYFRDCFKKQFGVNPSEYHDTIDQSS